MINYKKTIGKGAFATETIGLYIHVPFCKGKCPYCDFYSCPSADEETLDAYTAAVCRTLDEWAQKGDYRADTLYFGGGTPSLLGGERLATILRRAGERFSLFSGAPEVTMEANPADGLADTLAAFAAAGGNRLSLGMQSAYPAELALLGRRHTPADVERTVADARRAGIGNISLDVMLGISGQTADTVRGSVRCAAELGATHISAYMLKIEPSTPYGHRPPPLPDEDATAQMYLTAMETLEAAGYRQYEISNAALPGFESRHNLKYWLSGPYLGIGPAASSCLEGRRFTYPRDLTAFLRGNVPLEEPDAVIPTGSAAEFALLRLRLTAGLTENDFAARFGSPIPTAWREKAEKLPARLVLTDKTGIRLTREGFLVSNAVIEHILSDNF